MKVVMLAYAHYINDARIKNYVRTLEDKGHSVDVVALKSDGESPIEATRSGTIYRVMEKYQGQSAPQYAWSYIKFFFKALLFLTGRSFSNKYDVIHVHNMPNVLVFAAIVPKMFGAKVLLDVHDLMAVTYMAKFDVQENNIPVRLLKLEQRMSALLADHVICADHNQRDYLVERCRIPKDKISVLLNLPNTELLKPIQVQKQSTAFRIVYHGTIAHRLGIDLIVRAVARVADRIPAELWIYGAGDYLPEVLELSSQLGMNEKIHFSKSFFPVEKIPEIVCGMDLGIIGNRRSLACDKYMLPVKLLEYVYLGIPVVAPRLSVITQYFDDSMLRFYEPENVEQMADAIEDLFHRKDERERQANAAYKFYQTHSPDGQAERYVNLISSPNLNLIAQRVQ
jgi:glycosyltransferase involved in cell wall biosynthesis